MHLRSAQKRLLAAEAAARTDSAVGSSQQLDRTDSCGGPRDSADVQTTAAAAAAAPAPTQQPPAAQASRQQVQAEQLWQHPVGVRMQMTAPAKQPAPKRRRIMRAGIPAPLPPYELRQVDRPSPPVRWVVGGGCCLRRARAGRCDNGDGSQCSPY